MLATQRESFYPWVVKWVVPIIYHKRQHFNHLFLKGFIFLFFEQVQNLE